MVELIEVFYGILGGLSGAFTAVYVMSIILAVVIHVLIIWLVAKVALRIWDRREQKKMAALLPVDDRKNENEIGAEEPWMKARRIAAEQIAEAKKKSQQRKKKVPCGSNFNCRCGDYRRKRCEHTPEESQVCRYKLG